MKTFHVLAERPDVPEDWMIFNAPRPMWGTQEWYDKNVYLHGRWFAAISPMDPYKLDMLTRNEQDDGWLIVYHAEEQLQAVGWEWVEKNYPDSDLEPKDPWLTQKGLDILNENIV